MLPFPRAVSFSHQLVAQAIQPESAAVDATCGNGHDTVFLAERVGPSGVVYAFDIQERAIAETKRRLSLAGLENRVRVILAGHETLADQLREEPRPVRVVMFNLGYLPGGDKGLVTLPESTLAALRKALRLLAEDGLLTVVVYESHPGGEAEGAAVLEHLQALPQERFEVIRYGFLNQTNRPPYLVAARKIAA